MKSLLLEAYVKGQQELLYVVPFVAKVLESSIRSVVSFVLCRVNLIQYKSKIVFLVVFCILDCNLRG